MADCVAADALLDHLASAEIRHSDKGYDSNAVRRKIEGKGAAPDIPPKSNRRWKCWFSPYLYRHRKAIERMFARLKDFRRIATRYDRFAPTTFSINEQRRSRRKRSCLARSSWLRFETAAGPPAS